MFLLVSNQTIILNWEWWMVRLVQVGVAVSEEEWSEQFLWGVHVVSSLFFLFIAVCVLFSFSHTYDSHISTVSSSDCPCNPKLWYHSFLTHHPFAIFCSCCLLISFSVDVGTFLYLNQSPDYTCTICQLQPFFLPPFNWGVIQCLNIYFTRSSTKNDETEDKSSLVSFMHVGWWCGITSKYS